MERLAFCRRAIIVSCHELMNYLDSSTIRLYIPAALWHVKYSDFTYSVGLEWVDRDVSFVRSMVSRASASRLKRRVFTQLPVTIAPKRMMPIIMAGRPRP